MKALRGTRRPDRERGAWSAQGQAKPPKYLSKAARVIWKRTLAVLPEAMVTTGDEQLFAAYCQCVARVAALEVAVARDGFTIATPQGEVLSPQVKLLQQERTEMRRLSEHFGLSPASRQRVPAPKSPEQPAAPPVLPFARPRPA